MISKLKAESRKQKQAPATFGGCANVYSAFCLLPSAVPDRATSSDQHSVIRRAFTLVELMVVISIMAVLASLVLFAMAGATESAKSAKTQSTINKINAVIMAKYESYRTRRLPVDVLSTAIAKGYVTSNTTMQTLPAFAAARVRVDVVRDLMRMEMPDGFQDIDDGPLNPGLARPADSVRYLAALTAARARNSAAVNSTNLQQAMCLYWIVTLGSDDADVLEQFSSDEIATDSDTGLRYFVDGWGQAIYYLRWAPGFTSPLQPWDLTAATKNFPPGHDPFDPLHVYAPQDATDPFFDPSKVAKEQHYPPLYPLVYSAGPDKLYEVEVASGIRYATPTVNNDPYYTARKPPTVGELADANGDGVDNRVDNITNHDIGENQ